jgi:hypothetical protein
MEFALSGPHIKVPAAREYGMGAPGYFGNGQNKHGGGSKYAKQSSPTYSSSQVELPSSGYGGGYAADGPGPAGQDTMQQYLMQIGSLKKELKHRDDRLQVRDNDIVCLICSAMCCVFLLFLPTYFSFATSYILTYPAPT